LAPETAEIRQGDGGWLETPADKVVIGALARVKPGSRIPLDGRVSAGSSAVNQAPVTGESIPVDKTTGDPVFAGTINETSTLEFKVTANANNTTLARIIHAVEAAQGTRAPKGHSALDLGRHRFYRLVRRGGAERPGDDFLHP
jgi:Cd2+/Zn2+-exporting ATPase